MADERATRTVLAWGEISAPVALYKTTGDSGAEVDFERAGPHGGRVHAPRVTMEAIDAEAPSDPLSGRPSPGVTYASASSRPLLVEDGSDEPVVRSQDIRRGVFDNAEHFHDLTEHLQAVDMLTRLDEMRIEGFINRYKVPQLRVQGSYWLGPADGSGAVLRLLWTAMADEYRGAVVRWTKRTKQALGVIIPDRRGLVVLELAWAGVMREPRPEVQAMTDRDVPAAHRRLAIELLEAMEVDEGILDVFEDERSRLRRELHEAAMRGEDPPVPKPEPVDVPSGSLAEALRA